jgi:hypothetical protein
MRTTILALVVLLALIVAAPAQGAAPGLYRTDEQAARFLERTRGGSAFCLNGFYSKHEKRTGRHFANRGERFRSFGCTWTGRVPQGSGPFRSRDFYLQTRPGGRWVVLPDR